MKKLTAAILLKDRTKFVRRKERHFGRDETGMPIMVTSYVATSVADLISACRMRIFSMTNKHEYPNDIEIIQDWLDRNTAVSAEVTLRKNP